MSRTEWSMELEADRKVHVAKVTPEMLAYPIELTRDDNDTFMVTFPDIPGAVTFGDTVVEARTRAVDALETMLAIYIADRRDLPAPSKVDGAPTVSPTLLGSLKIEVYRAMRRRNWRKADLARALKLSPRQIDRLLDLRHGSTVAQLDQALRACGQRFEVSALEAA